MDTFQIRTAVVPAAGATSDAASPGLPVPCHMTAELDMPAGTLRVFAGQSLKGDITVSGAVLVEGEVRGTIVAKGPVVVAEGARVEGRVECSGDVIIAGAVVATGLSRTAIECHGKLILARSAAVAGNARFGTLETYRGASIQGALAVAS